MKSKPKTAFYDNQHNFRICIWESNFIADSAGFLPAIKMNQPYLNWMLFEYSIVDIA